MKKFIVVLFMLMMISTIVQASSFKDVDGLNCSKAVESLEYIGIINGVGVDEFAPQKNVTRAELSKMIVNALDAKNTSEKYFNDINGHWGEKFIKQAGGSGILNGYTDGSFKPDKSVSYAETIAIILRSIGFKNLENHNEKWYEGYISKMKEIGLDHGVEDFSGDGYANRGDVAILLWNAIKYDEKGKSLLEKNFSDYNYETNKITEINAYEGKVFYRTAKDYFYVDSGSIDFSDIGGMASGFFDYKNHIAKGLEIDVGMDLEKLSGNTKVIKEMGYDIFDCKNIAGYGVQEKAKYVEIFVNKATNKTERVVYYDTTESHFAEQLKIGLNKISIYSRDVYDISTIYHKEKLFDIKILRRETVKEINSSAVLVHDGKIVPWTSVPDNSVIRELKKDTLYTYVHEYFDIELSSKIIDTKSLILDGKKYTYSEECIAENVDTDTATKFSEGITRADLQTIEKNGEKVRLYISDFNEIVKFEFKSDIWGEKKEEKVEKERKEFESQLRKIGIVSDIYGYKSSKSGDQSLFEITITSLPRKSSYTYSQAKREYIIGELVYKTSGESKPKVIESDLKIQDLKIIYDYKGVYLINGKLGEYEVNNDTEYIEVVLEKGNGTYIKSYMNYVDEASFKENNRFSRMHLILDDKDVVLRVYAIREKGLSTSFGIVKNLVIEKSGDAVVSKKIYIGTATNSLNTYYPTTVNYYSSGDLITFDVQKADDTKSDAILSVREVYNHKAIGSKKDLIISSYNYGKMTFKNSDDTINLKSDTFKIGDKEYISEEYTIINAQVAKDKNSGEWVFKSFTIPVGGNIKVRNGDRFVIDELTKVIVIYSGYEAE